MLKRGVLAMLCSGLVWASPSFAHGGGLDKSGCHADSKTRTWHCHSARSSRGKIAPCDRKAPKAGDEGVFHGPLISITDGDTFKAKIQGVVMDFRLSDVDAPEMDQPYGPQAREQLRTLMRGKQVVMLAIDTDRYGRTIAHVWVDGAYVNGDVVQAGAAWFNTAYATSQCLYDAEQFARDAKRGLWKLPKEERIEPWEWRKQKREQTGRGEDRKKPPPSS
jgi:endonuclease YncB( thermonuclease family)